MTEIEIKNAVQEALEPIFHKVLHPDAYNNTESKRHKYKREAMQARYRLSARLLLLLTLKEVEISLVKSIMEDKEAIEDTKAARSTG